MKKKKLLLSILLVILAIIIVVTIFLGRYTDRIVDPFVRSLLEESKPMGHNIEYEKIRVNLFRGSIFVENVIIYPEDSLSKNRLRFNIDVSTIRLTDFGLWEILFNRSLKIQDIIVDDPNVNIILPIKTVNAINEVKERQAPKAKKQLLTNIFLERIIISGGDFKLYRNDTLLAGSTDINFMAQAINLVQNRQEEPIGYTFGDVSLSLRNIDLYPESGLYDMRLDLFEAEIKDSTVVLEGFKVIPKYDKAEFSTKLKIQTDRFDLNIDRVEIADVGLERWLNGEPLMISRVVIDGLDGDIHRDKNVTANLDLFPLFYNESFLKLKIPLYLDTLSIKNSKILYGELAVNRTVAGTILLDDFSIQSYNLTNQVVDDENKNFMQLFVQAKIMGEGNMNVELNLPLEGDLHKFECSGSVGAMELHPLNDMLEPAINIKFNGGVVDRMTFDFTANDSISNGWMEFLFSDLDVALLKKDADKQWGFVSLMANAVAVSNNPVDGKDVKIVEIGFERDKNKGIINYVYKTIQSGMVRTIIPSGKYRIEQEKDTKSKKQEKRDTINIEKKKKKKK